MGLKGPSLQTGGRVMGKGEVGRGLLLGVEPGQTQPKPGRAQRLSGRLIVWRSRGGAWARTPVSESLCVSCSLW